MSWAVVLCQLSDVPEQTEPKSFFVNFFTAAGRNTHGAFDYWNDLSYGRFANNSQVFGWFKIPHTSVDLLNSTDRQAYKQWGFDAAAAAGVGWTRFPRRIFFFNGNGPGLYGDHGDCGNGTTTFAYAPGRALEPTFMMHEMG